MVEVELEKTYLLRALPADLKNCPSEIIRDAFIPFAAKHPPDICLADVTQEPMIAGGILAGKTYEDLRPTLETYGYKPLVIEE